MSKELTSKELTNEEKLIIVEAMFKERLILNRILTELVPYQMGCGSTELADKNEKYAKDKLEKIWVILKKLVWDVK